MILWCLTHPQCFHAGHFPKYDILCLFASTILLASARDDPQTHYNCNRGMNPRNERNYQRFQQDSENQGQGRRGQARGRAVRMNGRGRGGRSHGASNNPTLEDQANKRATLYGLLTTLVLKINMQSYKRTLLMEVRLSNFLLIAKVLNLFYLQDV